MNFESQPRLLGKSARKSKLHAGFRYFGLRSFGEIYGYLFSALTLSGALGSLLMAMGFDRAGSYRLPLAFFLIATVTAAVLMTRLGQYRFRPA